MYIINVQCSVLVSVTDGYIKLTLLLVTIIFSECYRPSVCLSSVCNVCAPYSGDWNFRQYCYPIW